jgi:dTDP-4-dehydrorhamnose 3,5-epimerase-like enzyme
VWNDATLGNAWPLAELEGIAPEVSGKDARGARFADAELP